MDGNWWGAEVNITTTAIPNNRLSFGAETRENFDQNIDSTEDYPPVVVVMQEDFDSTVNGVYIQDEYSINDQWLLSAGLREDFGDEIDSRVSPRASLIYTPSDKTTLKFLYGSAFTSPSVFQLYYVQPFVNVPNPDLKEEEITTLELVLEKYIGNNQLATVSVYQYEIKDLITTEDVVVGFATVQQSQNDDDLSGQGLELELESQWKGDLKTRFSLALQDAEDHTGTRLTGSPETLIKLSVEKPIIGDDWIAALDGTYTGEQDLVKPAGLNNGTVDAFSLLNLTLSNQKLFNNRLSVSASIYNLLDEDYAHAASQDHRQDVIEQDGRTFRVKLDYTF
jgi:iron complex outermembrane receptor protein